MGNFNLDDYEPVEERIKRFYADHEDGRITADLLSDPNDITKAVVKAYLYTGDILVSTGLAFEKAGDGFVNKTSHLENCETSAIGRALANFNYAGTKRPSREEMQKATAPPDDPSADIKKKILDMVKNNQQYVTDSMQARITKAFKEKHKPEYYEEKVLPALMDEISTAEEFKPGLKAQFDEVVNKAPEQSEIF